MRVIKALFFITFIFCNSLVYGQVNITNENYFSNFFHSSDKKNLIILGENHASSVGSTVYPSIIKYLNKTSGLNTLLIEFGPSEAYFYNKYLKTGDEKWLNYTIFAGFYKGWREAWQKIYKYNNTLKEPLNVIGIDFDRTRTMAYALYTIFMAYDDKPSFVKKLMNEIKTDKFYNTYSIGYPTKRGIKWKKETKNILADHFHTLKDFLSSNDLKVVNAILNNQANDFNNKREKALAKNTKRIIKKSKEQDFFLLIGRSHAYIHPIYKKEKRLATMLIRNSKINILTGVTLFQNCILLGGKDGKEPITLFEIKNKKPWKKYYSILNRQSKNQFTIIPLKNDLSPLAYYVNYVFIARDQGPYKVLK